MVAEQIITKYKQLQSQRANLEPLWQECGDYGYPSNNQITRVQSSGQERRSTLFDSTGEDANVQLAAGIYSYMFPSESRAFTLKAEDEEIAEDDSAKQWLDIATKLVHQHLVRSNFRSAFFEFLLSLGCFGTSCLYEAKGKKSPLYFISHHIKTIYIDVNSDGVIDTVYRVFDYNARQAIQEFGEKLDKEILECRDSNKKFTFIHAVYPRDDYDVDKKDPKNMPFASVYVDKGHKQIVSESGYKELPYQISRFTKDSFENYGRSPMMKKLPDIKMLNSMQKTRIKTWEKQCDPPIILPDDGSISQVATQPGGVIYKRAGSDDPRWFEFRGNIQKMEEAILATKQDIMKGFYLDMFDPLIDRQNMTATEVMARVEQKMRFLTPIIGRLQSELFNPLIHRVLSILARQNLLPPMPEVLVNADYGIVYLGRLALAIKTLESEGLQKTLAEWAPLAEIQPNIFDNLDTDKSFRDSARNNGVPATWLTEIEERDMRRQQAQQAQQAQMMAEQAPNVAKAYKNASVKPEEGSPAEIMLGAM